MHIRPALPTDLEAIVAMLAADPLGKMREDYQVPLPDSYAIAFAAIDTDPNQELMVVEEADQVIGTLQLTFIPYLTYRGGIRAQIEAVRIHQEHRGKGIGEYLFRWAIKRAQERGAHLLQLTTDRQRPDAIRFYEKLGFCATHAGMKMHFKPFSQVQDMLRNK